MNDLPTTRDDWRDRAVALLTQPSADPMALLGAVREGIRLRRRCDESAIAQTGPRHELIRLLYQLQEIARGRLAELGQAPELRRRIGDHVSVMLQEDQEYLTGLLTRPELSPSKRALLLDAFGDDLEWASTLVARVDGVAPPDPSRGAEARLQRIDRILAEADSPAVEKLGVLRERSRRLHRTLLEQRVEEELRRPLDDAGPEDLWQRRLLLSRLQLDCELIGREADAVFPAADRLAEKLADRRVRLARLAEDRLAELSGAELGESWEELSLLARGEYNEIVTFIEDIALPSATRMLEVSLEDLETLARASRRTPTHEQSDRLDPRVRSGVRRINQLTRRTRSELQEKYLSRRMESIFGRRFVVLLENTVFVLILVITALIITEWSMDAAARSRAEAAVAAGASPAADLPAERQAGETGAEPGATGPDPEPAEVVPSGLPESQLEFFAWADLIICSVFLFEFFLKLSLAQPVGANSTGWLSRFPSLQGKALYFRRRWFVDFLASIPFGFLSHQAMRAEMLEGIQLGRLLRFLRLPRLARYIKVARPVIRFGRVIIFSLRATDQLVRRYAGVFNRNVVLFEPEEPGEQPSDYRFLLQELRHHYHHRLGEFLDVGADGEDVDCWEQSLSDLKARVDCLPVTGTAMTAAEQQSAREVRVEAVVQTLVDMTPEQISEQMGSQFVESVQRYVRMFDVPGIRRLPVLRDLVAHRQSGPAEVAALAANYAGHGIQGVLNVIYYLADLQGTITGPVFLDHLGTTLVNATARPAKRLIQLGVAFVILYLIVTQFGAPWPLDVAFEKLGQLLAMPAIILGLACTIPLLLGIWLRKIANQASDYCARVAEAQFATQTKALKLQAQEADSRFLEARVITAELELRNCDDRVRAVAGPDAMPYHPPHKREELVFLHNIKLFYQDYLDGALFHRSDTKTTTQLLGNLALSNLRLSNLAQMHRDAKRLNSLDLSRGGGALLGGPYLWFNYITRMITRQTAVLLLDHNHNAIPLDRLACSSQQVRRKYRDWLSRRLRIPAEEVKLPPPVGRFGDQDVPAEENRRPEADDFFETVDFTAVDFLFDSPKRNEEIRRKYGEQVAQLVRSDRQWNIRRAFRSFPLHEFPRAVRTVNFFSLYETYLGRGRVLVLPIRVLWWALRLAAASIKRLIRVIRDILKPGLAEEPTERVDSYAVAKRKIHRMRKPAFMEMLWLRARFDVEYLGLALPDVPFCAGSDSLLQIDLEYIGANRRERIAADQLRRDRRRRLERIGRWLSEFGWNFTALPAYLEKSFPYLGDRAAEVTRALVTAFVLDHDDVYTLAISIEGLRMAMAYAADPQSDRRSLPEGLPQPLDRKRPLWRLPTKKKWSTSDLFALPCFPMYNDRERSRILNYLRGRRWAFRGWTDVLLGQGGKDPKETVRARLREVIRRSDLWSDEILALRTIQSLTMLDVHHYSQLVWKLGGYDELYDAEFSDRLPFPTVDQTEAEGASEAYGTARVSETSKSGL